MGDAASRLHRLVRGLSMGTVPFQKTQDILPELISTANDIERENATCYEAGVRAGVKKARAEIFALLKGTHNG